MSKPVQPSRSRLAAAVALLFAVLLLAGAQPATASGTAAAPRPLAPPSAPPVGTGYRWPLDAPISVVRGFDPPPQPWLPGHRGIDLAAEPGVLVRAAGPGVVHFAGQVAGRGVVSVDHANGLRTTYEPLVPIVHTGESVRAGDPLGVLVAGHDGCPVTACLHWGLRHGAAYLDPRSLFGAVRVRLLPLDGGSAAGSGAQQGG